MTLLEMKCAISRVYPRIHFSPLFILTNADSLEETQYLDLNSSYDLMGCSINGWIHSYASDIFCTEENYKMFTSHGKDTSSRVKVQLCNDGEVSVSVNVCFACSLDSVLKETSTHFSNNDTTTKRLREPQDLSCCKRPKVYPSAPFCFQRSTKSLGEFPGRA